MSRLSSRLNGKNKGFYSYTVLFVSIAPAAVPSLPFQTDTDSDFFWMKSTMFADIAGAAQTDSSRVLPLLKVLLQDGASSRQLMKEELPVAALFGSGEIPYILPVPHRIAPGSTFNVSVRNYSAATTYANVYLVFSGVKVYLG